MTAAKASTRCQSCKGEHTDQVSTARCGLEHAIIADLTDRAGRLDQPPTKAQVRDLWAHARDMRGDGTAAAQWVRQVLDLGWRPTVGATS